MELDLLKQQIHTNKKLYDGRTEHIETIEIIVPDYLPDAKSIITSQAQINIKDKSAADDKITVSGEIHFTALFAAEGDQTPVGVTTRAPFREVFAVQGANSDTFCRVSVSLGQNDARVVNSRKIGFKAVAEIDVSAYEPQTIEIASSFGDAIHVETLKKPTELCLISACAGKQFSIEEDLFLPQSKPAAKELLSYRTKITLEDVKLIANKAILKGAANVFCLYSSDEETPKLETVENEIPFSLIIDIEGVDETHVADVIFEASESIVTMAKDSDARTITASISANAVVTTYKQTTLDAITDAFSTTHDLNLKTDDSPVLNLFENRTAAINIKDAISPPSGINVSRVVDVSSELSAFDISCEEGEIKLLGSVDVRALCIGSDGIAFSIIRTLPVNLSAPTDARGQISAEAKSPIIDTSFNLNMSGEIEVRLTADVLIHVFERFSLPRISAAEAEEKSHDMSAERPALYAYFLEKGETIWDIAKKYGASPSDIIGANKLSCDASGAPDNVNVLLIPRTKRAGN